MGIRAIVGAGAIGAIVPIDNGKEVQIISVNPNSLVILFSTRGLKFLMTTLRINQFSVIIMKN